MRACEKDSDGADSTCLGVHERCRCSLGSWMALRISHPAPGQHRHLNSDCLTRRQTSASFKGVNVNEMHRRRSNKLTRVGAKTARDASSKLWYIFGTREEQFSNIMRRHIPAMSWACQGCPYGVEDREATTGYRVRRMNRMASTFAFKSQPDESRQGRLDVTYQVSYGNELTKDRIR